MKYETRGKVKINNRLNSNEIKRYCQQSQNRF
ncbi:hypothetical protein NIES3806_19740 [Microcystis aeruginosa NIES-3806]|uniref:Uncharacterized protein n=4 Tax=Microcystis aeruginosa TaxID=1126 RepID=A0A6H9G255_MICAE|nr:hypothetical protein MAESPC_00421 [Microcystis aeruginosa SPC777]GCA73720.1 hypothetical protein MiTe_00539 [Microcystis aeruginosa NIES-2520]GCE60067.1 hypothetical protein MiAbB_01987 [Microcystis aeruginosa NIES-4285]GCL44587.1 hypothetical protein NIES3787_02630 [Microcystis aeruginosa NIES-3787]GCL54631.1 hypothetical protein NIES3806_19740 [Microcystis aeruginosa NIES-3806]